MIRSVNFEVMQAVDLLIKSLEMRILINQRIDHLGNYQYQRIVYLDIG
jgi:hypothetical protein